MIFLLTLMISLKDKLGRIDAIASSRTFNEFIRSIIQQKDTEFLASVLNVAADSDVSVLNEDMSDVWTVCYILLGIAAVCLVALISFIGVYTGYKEDKKKRKNAEYADINSMRSIDKEKVITQYV